MNKMSKSKAKLLGKYKESKRIKIRFASVGRFYEVSQEKACEMMDNGTMPREYWGMFDSSCWPISDAEKAEQIKLEAAKKAAAKKAEAAKLVAADKASK